MRYCLDCLVVAKSSKTPRKPDGPAPFRLDPQKRCPYSAASSQLPVDLQQTPRLPLPRRRHSSRSWVHVDNRAQNIESTSPAQRAAALLKRLLLPPRERRDPSTFDIREPFAPQP